jgi:adenylosuccinate synthase
MITAVVGINWGDEGKGRMVDLLSSQYDIVARYQGGNNAGHTVVNDRGKFILNLLPSGILRPETVNVMGPGMVIDLEHLAGEIKNLSEKGVEISGKNLKISDKATICMPYHPLLDGLEEDRMGSKKQGSTRRGIGPVYSDKYMRKSIRIGDLLYRDVLKDRLADIVEWKNLTVEKGYGHEPLSATAMYDWLMKFGDPIMDNICDTTRYLTQADDEGKSLLLEAQLGALRDLDFGIFPYTSSSCTLAAYAPLGAGIPAKHLDNVVGIMKAYSSAVGGGPFVCEFSGQEAHDLREAGGEYGAATGRPRRVGGFDVVASKYGVQLQGATELAVTKLDVLSGMEKIPVCTAYELNGQRIDYFPLEAALEQCKPVYEYMEGFSGDITGCRKFSDLPVAAQKYVRYLEEAVGCKIRYVSVGADRDQYIDMN